MTSLELGTLSLERGAHLLIKRALRELPVGGQLEVRGGGAVLEPQLAAWCRAQGHRYERKPEAHRVTRGSAELGRWRGAQRAGIARGSFDDQAVLPRPDPSLGLAARGARVELGTPAFHFPFSEKAELWADDAGKLYLQAAAQQWDPGTAIDWRCSPQLPIDVEDAVVQIMTYLIENETAALMIPARFIAGMHPHFREVMQLLAVQAADEARHIEVFTRRALLCRSELGLSTAGGQASLKTLLDEPEFALASFLLSVLGEGSFLSLLRFISEQAKDPVTASVCRLAGQDEARHVAFGISHLSRHVANEPGYLGTLAAAVRRRHAALADTAGLNEEVFDALVLLAAGSYQPAAISHGWDAVLALQAEMDDGRRRRLMRLGFSAEDAQELSALHTRNFM